MSEWSRAGVTPRGVRPPARSATHSLSAMAGGGADDGRLDAWANQRGGSRSPPSPMAL